MNGSVPSMFDKVAADKIDEKSKELLEIFYRGDKLSKFERDTERMYISEKLEKHYNYKKRNSYRYKVKWTVSDLNRF